MALLVEIASTSQCAQPLSLKLESSALHQQIPVQGCRACCQLYTYTSKQAGLCMVSLNKNVTATVVCMGRGTGDEVQTQGGVACCSQCCGRSTALPCVVQHGTCFTMTCFTMTAGSQ